MRFLGAHCAGSLAYLSVVEDGQVVLIGPQRVAPAASVDSDAALWETLDSFRAALREVAPSAAAILLPGTGAQARQTHSALSPRIELETLLRLACVKEDVPIDRLPRATVRSRLGAARSGSFETVVGPLISPVGGFWNAGRLCAAAAALAVEVVHADSG